MTKILKSHLIFLVTIKIILCFTFFLYAQEDDGPISISNIQLNNTSRLLGKGVFEWKLFIEAGDPILKNIKCVEYTLHPTFSPSKILICDTDGRKNFSLTEKGGEGFKIYAKVIFKDNREHVLLTHWLKLRNLESTNNNLLIKDSPQKRIKTITIATLDQVFATLSDSESGKSGYDLVGKKGKWIDLDLEVEPNEYKSIKALYYEFHACYYANDNSGGTVKIEVEAEKKIGEKSFSITNRMNDWRRYTNKKYLKKYKGKKILSIPAQKKLTKIRIFIHPGFWAVVIKDLKIKAKVDY